MKTVQLKKKNLLVYTPNCKTILLNDINEEDKKTISNRDKLFGTIDWNEDAVEYQRKIRNEWK